MDRPTFLLISFTGFLSMVILHLLEIWVVDSGISLKQFLVEWLPLYLVWMVMLVIGLLKRSTRTSSDYSRAHR